MQANFTQPFKGKVFVIYKGTDAKTGKLSTYSIDGFWESPRTANEVNERLAANGGKVSFLIHAQIIHMQNRNWVAGEFRM